MLLWIILANGSLANWNKSEDCNVTCGVGYET